MDEVENQGVLQQETDAQQEIAAPQTESDQGQSTQKAEAQAIPNHAWAAMRKKNEELERKAYMQEELLKKVLQPQMQQQQVQPQEDILADISKEEYVPGDKVAKLFKARDAEYDRKLQDLEQRYRGIADNTVLAQIKRDHADFDDIVNPDTLALLKEIDPRRAEALEYTNDPYIRWATTYDIIKARGISDQVPNAKRAKEVDKKIEQNKKVVQSPQAYDKRPMAKAFDYARMDKKAQEALQDEMHHYAKMAHGVPQLGI